MDDLAKRLKNAADESLIVRVEREEVEGKDAWSDGFVMAFSETFLLLHLVSHSIYLDGYQVLRLCDISALHDPTPYFKFQRRALKLRKQKPIPPRATNIDSLKSILQSVNDNYSLVVINRELADPDVCEIGKIASLGGEGFHLTEIDPDAQWDEDDTYLPYDEVTRIDFDGGYENALALVAEIGGS